jgi:hypothetical protein
MSISTTPPAVAPQDELQEAVQLVVLCSDQATHPVINTGTLYQ